MKSLHRHLSVTCTIMNCFRKNVKRPDVHSGRFSVQHCSDCNSWLICKGMQAQNIERKAAFIINNTSKGALHNTTVKSVENLHWQHVSSIPPVLPAYYCYLMTRLLEHVNVLIKKSGLSSLLKLAFHLEVKKENNTGFII